jgi:hypothetical protein
MNITDIAEPAPEPVNEEETIEAGNEDTNTSGNIEENKFQRAIAAWRSMAIILYTFAHGTDNVL